MALATVVVLLSVPLSGGDLRRLSTVTVRAAWLLPAALGLQAVAIAVLPATWRPVSVGLHLLTYAMAAAFVWQNQHVPGLILLSLGAASNGVTIALNGGTLPASPAALARAGLPADPGHFTNSGVLAHPHLGGLGDVFAVPAWFPFANVFSLGDVLIVVGAAWFAHATCRSPRAGELSDVLLELSVEHLRAEVDAARRALAAAEQRQARLLAQHGEPGQATAARTPAARRRRRVPARAA
jgi:hypothetical protein